MIPERLIGDELCLERGEDEKDKSTPKPQQPTYRWTFGGSSTKCVFNWGSGMEIWAGAQSTLLAAAAVPHYVRTSLSLKPPRALRPPQPQPHAKYPIGHAANKLALLLCSLHRVAVDNRKNAVN